MAAGAHDTRLRPCCGPCTGETLRFPEGMHTRNTRTTLLLPAAIVLWLAVLYGIRFGLMEVEPAADPCLGAPDGLLCRGRAALGLTIHFQAFGITALAMAALAWLVPAPRRSWLATAALLVALPALVLYNVRFGAPAAVVALLALADAGALRPTTRTSP
jgi:hypothetical protein